MGSLSNARPRWLLAATLLVAGPSPAEDPGDVCSVPWNVTLEMNRLNRAVAACGSEAACLEKAHDAWQTLLGRYPRAFVVHREYAKSWSPEVLEKETARSERRLAASPREPLALTLHARNLMADRPEDAVRLLQKALEEDPRYPWAHFSLAWRYHGGEKDNAKARPHVLGLAEACPDSWLAGGLFNSIGEADLVREGVGLMRRAAETLPPDRGTRAYVNIWGLTFRGLPPEQHEAVRALVREEVARVASWRREDSWEWWSALEAGYEITGDAAARDAARQRADERFPCERDPLARRFAAWDKEHPRPKGADMEAWRRDRLAFTKGVVEGCPESVMAWFQLQIAAVEQGGLSDEEMGRIADGAIEAYARGEMKTHPSPFLRAADTYMERGFRLDRVADLVEKDRRAFPLPDLQKVPENARPQFEQSRRRQDWDWRWREARAKALTGTLSDETLAGLEALVGEETDVTLAERMRAQVAWVRGDRAAGLGRWGDAFAFYQQAHTTLAGERALARRREEAWARTGGTAEGLALLSAPPKAPIVSAENATDWKTVEQRFPALSMPLLGGGVWSAEAFKGKRTLVNVWATWCEPCKLELPVIQKLYERFKDSKDLAVVTLNVDHNPGLIQPFLRESGYTFPVVLATEQRDGLGGATSIPTNWIIDDGGTIRLESVGFNPTKADEWSERAVRRLETPGS